VSALPAASKAAALGAIQREVGLSDRTLRSVRHLEAGAQIAVLLDDPGEPPALAVELPTGSGYFSTEFSNRSLGDDQLLPNLTLPIQCSGELVAVIERNLERRGFSGAGPTRAECAFAVGVRRPLARTPSPAGNSHNRC